MLQLQNFPWANLSPSFLRKLPQPENLKKYNNHDFIKSNLASEGRLSQNLYSEGAIKVKQNQFEDNPAEQIFFHREKGEIILHPVKALVEGSFFEKEEIIFKTFRDSKVLQKLLKQEGEQAVTECIFRFSNELQISFSAGLAELNSLHAKLFSVSKRKVVATLVHLRQHRNRSTSISFSEKRRSEHRAIAASTTKKKNGKIRKYCKYLGAHSFYPCVSFQKIHWQTF